MNASAADSLIPPRLRRPFAAAWISLGVHAALIALLQVAPPAPVRVGEPTIEVRLVPAHAGQAEPESAPAAETPQESIDAPPKERVHEAPTPRLAPLEAKEALPLALPPEAPAPAPQAPPATAGGAVAEQPAAAAAAEAVPDAALTSAVDLTYYSARDLDVQPRALAEIVPDYPAEADRRRVSGKVRLLLELQADGRISDVDVVSATPPGVFEASAIEAFRDARFAPAQKNGRPVRARVVIEVVYDWAGHARPH